METNWNPSGDSEELIIPNEYLKALVERDNQIAFFKGEWTRTKEELEKTAEELEKTAEELEKTAEELEKTAEELEKTAEELENERKAAIQKDQLILTMAKMLKDRGVSPEAIQQQTGLTLEQIQAL